MKTLADFRRAAVVGSRWTCTNHMHPNVSGPRVITKASTRHLEWSGAKADGTPIAEGWTDNPKAAMVRFDGDLIHFLRDDRPGEAGFTWKLQQDKPASVDELPALPASADALLDEVFSAPVQLDLLGLLGEVFA